VGLFGVSAASDSDGGHGGEGLNFVLDITKIVDSLHLTNSLDVNSLPVRIVPHRAVPDKAEISVGRVSIYREGA
jgi:tyrosinase